MGYRYSFADRERLESVRCYLAEHLDAVPRVAMLCALAAMSRQKLNAGFERFYGLPVQSYLLRLRMEKAREMLQTTEESMAAIADASGYQHQSSFSKAYKQYYGLSPRMERQSGGGSGESLSG